MKQINPRLIPTKNKLEKANQCKREGKSEEALSLYLQVLEAVPNCVPALIRLSHLYTQFEQWEQVADTYKQVIASQPDRIDAYLKLGQALKKTKDIDNAIIIYQKLLSFNPNQPIRVYLELGDLLGEKNRTDEQIHVYSQAIYLKPDLIKLHNKLAQAVLKKKGKLEELAKIGNFSDTITFYRELLSHSSFLEKSTQHSDRVHSKLGELILQQSISSEKLNEASAFFLEASKADANNPWYLYHLGRCKEQQNQRNSALYYYRTAINLNPDFIESHLKIGENLTQNQQWDLAFESYLKAINANPNSPLINRYLQDYFQTIGNILSPKQVESKVQAYHKTQKILSVGKAEVLMQAGQIEEAVQLNHKICFENFRNSFPEYVKNYWNKGKSVGPSFFVIGVMKGGTTALYHYITQHPKILPALLKEPNRSGLAQTLNSNKFKYYLSLFPPVPESREFITGEASTSYINDPKVISNVLNYFPDSRLIVILRNPIDRLISQYYYQFYQLKGKNLKSNSLEEIVSSELEFMKKKKDLTDIAINPSAYANCTNLLRYGLYVYLLEKWMKFFPREQFLILRNEDLSQEPAAIMSQVFEFLEVPDYPDIQYPRKNTTTYPSQIDESLLTRLQDFYQPHNQRLEEFLGRKFNWD